MDSPALSIGVGEAPPKEESDEEMRGGEAEKLA